MFYKDVIAVIKSKDMKRLEEIFTNSDADPNAREFFDCGDDLLFGDGLLSGTVKALQEEPDETIIPFVDFLIKKGAKINPEDCWNPIIHYAVLYNKVKLTEYLIKQGAKLYIGEFCLAASFGHIEILKLYLKEKFDVNARDDCNQTALMWSVMRTDGKDPSKVIEIIQLLIRHGADITVISQIGNNKHRHTAMSMAYNAILDAQGLYKLFPTVDNKLLVYGCISILEFLFKAARIQVLFQALKNLTFANNTSNKLFIVNSEEILKTKITEDELSTTLKQIALDLTGEHSITVTVDDKMREEHFRNFQNLILQQVYTPVYEVLKQKVELLTSAYSEVNEKSKENQLSLTWLFNEKLLEPNQTATVFKSQKAPKSSMHSSS